MQPTTTPQSSHVWVTVCMRVRLRVCVHLCLRWCGRVCARAAPTAVAVAQSKWDVEVVCEWGASG